MPKILIVCTFHTLDNSDKYRIRGKSFVSFYAEKSVLTLTNILAGLANLLLVTTIVPITDSGKDLLINVPGSSAFAQLILLRYAGDWRYVTDDKLKVQAGAGDMRISLRLLLSMDAVHKLGATPVVSDTPLPTPYSILGSGTYGCVFSGVSCADHDPVGLPGAVSKVLEIADAREELSVAKKVLEADPEGLYSAPVLTEEPCQAPSYLLSDPCVRTKFSHAEPDSEPVFVMLNYANAGKSLQAIMDDPSLCNYTANECLQFMLGAMQCVKYFQDRKVFHFDLNQGNIVRDAAGVVRLIDFGGSPFEESFLRQGAIPTLYLCPYDLEGIKTRLTEVAGMARGPIISKTRITNWWKRQKHYVKQAVPEIFGPASVLGKDAKTILWPHGDGALDTIDSILEDYAKFLGSSFTAELAQLRSWAALEVYALGMTLLISLPYLCPKVNRTSSPDKDVYLLCQKVIADMVSPSVLHRPTMAQAIARLHKGMEDLHLPMPSMAPRTPLRPRAGGASSSTDLPYYARDYVAGAGAGIGSGRMAGLPKRPRSP